MAIEREKQDTTQHSDSSCTLEEEERWWGRDATKVEAKRAVASSESVAGACPCFPFSGKTKTSTGNFVRTQLLSTGAPHAHTPF